MIYLVWEEKMKDYREVSAEELEKFRQEREYWGDCYQIDVVRFEGYEDGKMYFIVETFEC